MKWAADAIEKLKLGEHSPIWPRGHSMSGRIEDGQCVWLEPLVPERLQLDDVVLVAIQGKKREVVVLHQVIELDGERCLIGARNGQVDGWVAIASILGRVTQIES
ncbi:hypothetical protein EON80_31320 [bacterium]|nr:MAG: hypothetical protein EON80_31320 [bacterium]